MDYWNLSDDAKVLANGRYDGPWAVYNLNGQARQLIDAFWSGRASLGGELIGFSCVGAEARVPGLEEIGLPRVFRTALFAPIYAANCEFRYSVRTSWGVR